MPKILKKLPKHKELKNPPQMKLVTVPQFSRHCNTLPLQIYKLIRAGILFVEPVEGYPTRLNLFTQEPRYFYYREIQNAAGGRQPLNEETKRMVDNLVEKRAPYAKVTNTSNANIDPINRKPINGKQPGNTLEIPNENESIMDIKIRKERVAADKAELELKIKRGTLINKEKVSKVWQDIGVKVQKAVLAIPDRLSPVLAAENDHHKIHRLLTTELKHSLTLVSQDIQEMKL